MDQIFLSIATVFERGYDLDQAAETFEVYVQRMVLEAIGGIVRNVEKLDFKMDSKTKGRFARMTVFINLDRPLVSQVPVNGEIQLVEYEALPMTCFVCGKYGHVNELCPSVVVDLNQKIILGSRFLAFNEVGKMEDDEGVTGEHSSGDAHNYSSSGLIDSAFVT
ncbi:hypothetical protein Goshw_004594 [Gossypium schwendimanii]|uniref:CCHC-type domain-containing protein n=1 Tax=Gossypium schwendimanii TaxID=34291 RepID=A0A7J9LE73_GOSSC|nr:hypothetical protein [Gossypium schwendimanii]